MSHTPISYILSLVSGQSSALRTNFINNTGGSINLFTPVRINTSGELSLVDVSSELATASIGVTSESIANTTAGMVVMTGKLENLNLFNYGDVIYISKAGGLTNVKPSEGVSGFIVGDWVIKVGIIAKNETNPLNKDLYVNIEVVGQL